MSFMLGSLLFMLLTLVSTSLFIKWLEEGGIKMKTYKIEFYINAKCVLVLNDVEFDFDVEFDCRGYSKEDLINYLWVYGYIGIRDATYLLDKMNGWVIKRRN